jgi:CheY-like chemotaxis protein
VSLPRSVALLPPPADVRPGLGEGGGHETLLVVEDDETILALTRVGLERKGYRVLPVRTPAAAIEAAQAYAGDIHLLLTDVVMPEMNGRELADRLSALRPRLRALFMSGYSINVAGTGGMLDEGMPFISKPFSAAALAAKVREALDT